MRHLIRRGQSVNWRMTLLSGGQLADMAGGTWSVIETTFPTPPAFVNSGLEARMLWTALQTLAMKAGRHRLRISFTQPNGEVKAFPDMWITVQ